MKQPIPFGLAAGLVKTDADVDDNLVRSAASFITMGSYTLDPREGNGGTTYWSDQIERSYNAINLKNNGVRYIAESIPAIAERLLAAGKTLRISLAPTKPGHAKRMMEILCIEPMVSHIAMSTINAACPNHRDGDRVHEVLANDPEALRELMAETVGFRTKKAIKIAPKMEEDALRRVCELCEFFNFSHIVSGNTDRQLVPEGQNGKPVLQTTPKQVTHAGMAGPILLKNTLRQVEFLADHITKMGYVDLEIIACGGITTGQALKSAEDAGANEAKLATGFADFGAKIFNDIVEQYAYL